MKYSVVVVDDERLIAKNIAKNIEAINPAFEVAKICSCGSEALEYVQKHLPNVVFTDIRMPEMDGLELAGRLYEEYPFITCVIVSGYNDFEYAKNAIEFQVKDYLLKPVNHDELKKCLDRIEKNIQIQYPCLKNASEWESAERSPEEIVNLVKEYINKNYKDAIDLTSISANMGFSSPYLTKIFTKYQGITPSRYLKEYRIAIAKQLLKDKTLPISAISEQTGFADQFHFSKTFKAETGMSPTEYRANLPGFHL